VLGVTTDKLFVGNFANDNGVADGFDKLAAYGRWGNSFYWFVDVDNDGVSDVVVLEPLGRNASPVAGNFNPAIPGDQVGFFDGTRWFLDTTGDYNVNEQVLIPGMRGYPIVGDFNGEGTLDLATWSQGIFQISLGGTPGGVGSLGWDTALIEFHFDFIGVRARPLAADMDQDGITDIGLWVPDRSGITPQEGGEWFFLISHGTPLVNKDAAGNILMFPDTRLEAHPVMDSLVIPFTPVPFGHDIHAQFGNEFAIPLVGNFDPPVAPTGGSFVEAGHTNPDNPFDVNGDGIVSAQDVLVMVNDINANGARRLGTPSLGPPYLDVNGDGWLTAADVIAVINRINSASSAGGEGEWVPAAPVPAAAPLVGAAQPAITTSESDADRYFAEEPFAMAEDRSETRDPAGDLLAARRSSEVREDELIGLGDELESVLDDLAVDIAQLLG
jgi:hypothetical protein